MRWALEHDFDLTVSENIPKIHDRFVYSTTKKTAERFIIGKSQEDIENHYGLALFVDKTKGKHRSFFRHLDIVDDERHYKGIFVDFDKNGLGKNITYKDRGETRFLDIFPYVEELREYEPNKIMRFILYDRYRFQPQWWNNFRQYNMFTGFLCFGVDVLIWIFSIILFILFSRIVVNPILQLFTFTSVLNNGIVILLSTIVIFVAAYLSFILLIFIEDGFFFIGLIFILVLVAMMLRNKSNIQYNRCPSCHTMYSALGEGSTYTGRTTSVTWGTYNVDKGITGSGSNKIQHIEQRSKKTTEDVDHYLDHRLCASCGYNWDVDREESEEYTEHL